MGMLLMLFLGTVYAWSFFQKPIVSTLGWTNSQAAWAFSISILCIGFAASWGGINLPKIGPTKLAMIGGALHAVGYILGGLAFKMHSLPVLYLGFGLVGGMGLGLGYVVPVATVAKWFPDKKGLATGLVVMGFGLGALVMSKLVAPVLMGITNSDLTMTFVYIGILMFATMIWGAFLKNPPAGYVPTGFKPPVASASAQQAAAVLTAGQCVKSGKFSIMWILLFINVTAGIMFIGFQSPMLQDILSKRDPGMDAKALAAAGATLIAVSSLFNGIGRFLWGSISDKIGRVQAFRLILGTQLLVFIALRFVNSPVLFGVLVCYVLLCYGGGFGTMPAFVLDVFGAKLMAFVYGVILTAWSFAGIAGPQIAAYVKDNYANNAGPVTFTIGAVLLLVGLAASFSVNNQPYTGAAKQEG